jgi:hypothetical protein
MSLTVHPALHTDATALEAEASTVASPNAAPHDLWSAQAACHQPWFDPAAVANDQGGGTIRHGLHDAGPAASVGLGHGRDPGLACDQLSVGASEDIPERAGLKRWAYRDEWEPSLVGGCTRGGHVSMV